MRNTYKDIEYERKDFCPEKCIYERHGECLIAELKCNYVNCPLCQKRKETG